MDSKLFLALLLSRHIAQPVEWMKRIVSTLLEGEEQVKELPTEAQVRIREFAACASAAQECVNRLIETAETLRRIDFPDVWQPVDLYYRKSELLQYLANKCNTQLLNRCTLYQGNFIPISQLYDDSAQTDNRNATIISEEGAISNAFQLRQDFRVMLLGTTTLSSIRSDLPTALTITKEHAKVVIKEGPTSKPVARWRLQPHHPYRLRSGLLFNIGSAIIMFLSVNDDECTLRWRQVNQAYSPPFTFSTSAQPVCFIGRLSDCSITINDRSVSKRHLKVAKENIGWQIYDLASSNGTYQYLHTHFTLSSESEEVLVDDQFRLLLDQTSALNVVIE